MALPPFQALLDEHGDDVYRFLANAVGPEEAHDCFQETFIAALRAYPRLRDGSNLRGWLLKIASRKAIDAHRARARRPLPVEAVPEAAVELGDPSDDGLWTLVREFPPKQRGALLLRFVNDLSFREIGGVIGCSEEAARRSLFEGLERLRQEVAA